MKANNPSGWFRAHRRFRVYRSLSNARDLNFFVNFGKMGRLLSRIHRLLRLSTFRRILQNHYDNPLGYGFESDKGVRERDFKFEI